jgi:hypothetical protein
MSGAPPAITEQTEPLTRTPIETENELMSISHRAPKWAKMQSCAQRCSFPNPKGGAA